MKTIAKFAMSAAAIGGFAFAAAPVASANVHPIQPAQTYRAVTQLTDRPDSGANGTWADDTFTRVLTITRTGGTTGAYTFSAKVVDTGTFTTIPGAFTPNQDGTPGDGDLITSQVTGSMDGSDTFTFTATTLPSTASNLGVAKFMNDGGSSSAPSDTSDWYTLAFPSSTVISDPSGDMNWSWKYSAEVVTVTYKGIHPVIHYSEQYWTDSEANGGGNSPGDGNISG